MSLPRVHLKARTCLSTWVHRRIVVAAPDGLPSGSLVDAFTADDRFAGRGFYNSNSSLSLCLLTTDPDEQVDVDFFLRRLHRAIALRHDWLHLGDYTNAYRLVHGAADSLPGLIVDRLGDTIVLEVETAGMHRFAPQLAAALQEMLDLPVILYAEARTQKDEQFCCHDERARHSILITEQGVRFQVVPGRLQRIGFALERRNQRAWLTRCCQGRHVLDLGCRAGGFAICAKVLGGAATVRAVDPGPRLLDHARHNAALNGAAVEWLGVDLEEWLRDQGTAAQRYDVVVLNSSRVAHDSNYPHVETQRDYFLSRQVLQLVTPGGLLLSCSAAQPMERVEFLAKLYQAAKVARRQVQVLASAGAAEDHPWSWGQKDRAELVAALLRVL